MFRVMLWKEWREQRAVCLAVLLLGILAVALPAAYEPDLEKRHPLQIVLILLLGWMVAMIAGGGLIAGEREAGVLALLTTQPIWLSQFWRAKASAAAVLAFVVTIGLFVMLLCWQPFPQTGTAAPVLIGMLLLGGIGFSCAALFSARSETALRAITAAVVAQFVGVLPILFFTVWVWTRIGGLPAEAVFLAQFALVPLLLYGAQRRFGQEDHLRKGGLRELGWMNSYRVLAWMLYRQTRVEALTLLIAAFLAPIALHAGPLAWPIYTMVLGVVCGVSAFRDAQTDAARFHGEQRIPPGRLWTVKVGLAFLFAVMLAGISLLPGMLVPMAGPPPANSGEELHWALVASGASSLEGFVSPGAYLTIPLLYGFTSGVLAGQWFARRLSALVVGLGGAYLAVLAIAPSVLGGALHLWQSWSLPVVVLVLSRWSTWGWATGRLERPALLVRLAGGLSVGLVLFAFAIYWRVGEIPAGSPLETQAFADRLPPLADNRGGQLSRQALSRLRIQLQTHPRGPVAPGGGAPGGPGVPPGADEGLTEDAVVSKGWPARAEMLGKWLDAVCTDDWIGPLAQVADEPPGMLFDPRIITLATPLNQEQDTRQAAVLLGVRGLQKQAEGDPEAFLPLFRSGLALSRTVRNHAPLIPVLLGWATEGVLLNCLDRWLEKLDGRPDLLQRALAIQQEHLNRCHQQVDDHLLAEYFIARQSLLDPAAVLSWNATPGSRGQAGQLQPLLALTWAIPWERERRIRLLELLYTGNPSERWWALTVLSPLGAFGNPTDYGARMENMARRQRTVQNAHLILTALRLYQAEKGKGKPAETLQALVPAYLPSLPPDPFSGESFRYRLSSGERVTVWSEPEEVKEIQRGQGILWSVGEDGRDDGGIQQAPRRGIGGPNIVQGTDLIFPVPLPPPAKPGKD